MGRRQPRGREPVHHLEGGAHAGAGIAEVEHHAVAQPLDGLAAVLHGAALHQPRDRRGQVGGRVVAALLGQPRVAGDVEEADRRESLEAAVDARLRHQHLEAFDDVGGPGSRLLRVVHGEDGLLGRAGRSGRRARRSRSPPGPCPRPMAGSITSEFHQAASCSAIRRVLSPVDAEQALDGGRPEPLGELELDERHDRHLVLAEPVVGRRLAPCRSPRG